MLLHAPGKGRAHLEKAREMREEAVEDLRALGRGRRCAAAAGSPSASMARTAEGSKPSWYSRTTHSMMLRQPARRLSPYLQQIQETQLATM